MNEKNKVYYLCLAFTKQQYNIVKQSKIMINKPMGQWIYNAKRWAIVSGKKYINRFVLDCVVDDLIVIIKPYPKHKLVYEAVDCCEDMLITNLNKKQIIKQSKQAELIHIQESRRLGKERDAIKQKVKEWSKM